MGRSRLLGLLLVVFGVALVAFTAVALAALPPGGTFVDDDGNIHEGMIEAIAAEGITKGCAVDPLRYCPSDEVSRAEMATFVVRAAKEDGNLPPYQGYFADVPAGQWFTGYVERFYELDYTKGCDSDPLRFCPSDSALRNEMAAFLVRLIEGDANLPAYQGYFDDVPAGKWYTPYVERLYELDITKGCDVNPLRYCPLDFVLRDQMASFLGRTLGLNPIVPPPTTSSTTTTTSSTTTTTTTQPLPSVDISLSTYSGTSWSGYAHSDYVSLSTYSGTSWSGYIGNDDGAH